MPVVVHHAVGLHRDRIALEALSENCQKIAIILGPQEQGCVICTVMDDMEITLRVETRVVSLHECAPVISKDGAGFAGDRP
jgi:hypothetical protein